MTVAVANIESRTTAMFVSQDRPLKYVDSVLSIGIAALVVWAGKQTWDWTQRMTLPKTAACFALGWVALVVLATQEYNPFIYFIF